MKFVYQNSWNWHNTGVWLYRGKRVISRQYIIVSKRVKQCTLANIRQPHDANTQAYV